MPGHLLESDANPQNKNSSSKEEEFFKGMDTCRKIRHRTKNKEKRCSCCLIQVLKRYETSHAGWGSDAVSYKLLSAILVDVQCERAKFKQSLISAHGKPSIMKWKIEW